MNRHVAIRWFLTVVIVVTAAGCTPSLSPLYRDFKAPQSDHNPPVSDEATTQRLREALREAGWQVAASKEGILVTEPRTIRDLGLYEINVHLEVLPMNETYARVLFHPFRVYVFGRTTKLLFLKPSIRENVLPPLEKALRARGFRAEGTARSRAREDTGDDA